MKRNFSIAAALILVVVALATLSGIISRRAVVQAAGTSAPRFEVDPFWPKPLPNH